MFPPALPLELGAPGTIMTVCLQIRQQRQNCKELQMMKNWNSHFAIQLVSHFLFLPDLAWIINVGLASRYLRKQIQHNAIMEKSFFKHNKKHIYKTWNNWQCCTNLNQWVKISGLWALALSRVFLWENFQIFMEIIWNFLNWLGNC